MGNAEYMGQQCPVVYSSSYNSGTNNHITTHHFKKLFRYCYKSYGFTEEIKGEQDEDSNFVSSDWQHSSHKSIKYGFSRSCNFKSFVRLHRQVTSGYPGAPGLQKIGFILSSTKINAKIKNMAKCAKITMQQNP